MKLLLFAISLFFKGGVSIRNLAFDRGWIQKINISLPVISIGNIVAGGTGKTAFIQKLGKELVNKGKMAILSRGYRSKIKRCGGYLHLHSGVLATPDLCGDEPYLLWQSLPQAELFIGKNRVLNARAALSSHADFAILDDGMQYRRLHRDLEIVLLNGEDLYGKGFFLPRGYLRDFPKRLKSVDAIVINCMRDDAHFEQVEKEVAKWSLAPIIGVRMVGKGVKTACGLHFERLDNMRVGVFCGLGNPDSFFTTVGEMGAEIGEKWILPDHIGAAQKTLNCFSNKCLKKGCEMIICSEKDWVKVKEKEALSIMFGCLYAELEVTHGQERYEALLNRIGSLFL